jgi:hypothetical protein
MAIFEVGVNVNDPVVVNDNIEYDANLDVLGLPVTEYAFILYVFNPADELDAMFTFPLKLASLDTNNLPFKLKSSATTN